MSCSEDTARVLLQMHADKTYLAEEIAKGTEALKTEIQAVGNRMADLEAQVERVVKAYNAMVDSSDDLRAVEGLLEDLSNRSQGFNVRKRCMWKPIADVLRTKEIQFAWWHPFKLLAFRGSRMVVLQPGGDIAAFWRALDTEDPGLEIPQLMLTFTLPRLPRVWVSGADGDGEETRSTGDRQGHRKL
ncbi:hypothetical protein XELAEV_18003841mg [Pelobates cultripes]|uniref:Uncharacterized protein n=1 Tax=Pelobates cultripes TaxID=61616 RepID=A0AAD1SCD2_PELCU|nr:hypothetical protein XELAEV_18003841mg [Pelobates cultripes]